jgi:alkylation response protein AidB-like acyl-CoA dehydrogenase
MSSLVGERTVEAHRADVVAWIERDGSSLSASRSLASDLNGEMAYDRHLARTLWADGIGRWGWPESIGGFGGSVLLRAVLAEELARRDLVHQNIRLMPEVLGAPVAAMASDGLLPFVEPYLSGQEWWCQGFSEPGAGSDLAGLATRADPIADGYVVNGQKVWTSLAQFAQRCVLLVRTGTEGHRGITALFVDMDSPGITVRPIDCMHGEDEFCELFFDDVVVPGDRVIGEVGGGWSVAMNVLAAERASIFWMRSAWLLGRFTAAVASGDVSDAALGEVYLNLMMLRSRSRETQHAMAAGRFDAASSSIDKVLMATAERSLFDALMLHSSRSSLIGNHHQDARARTEFLYSRAATIYGGTSEIQRTLIAQRVLGLPRGER